MFLFLPLRKGVSGPCIQLTHRDWALQIRVLELNLGSLASVREFVKKFKDLKLPLNILM